MAVVDGARSSAVGAAVTPPVGSGLPVYGLTSNPFLHGELDPLARPQDLPCISLVDGWGDLTTAVELIGRRVAVEEPVYFVVEGASQTGRSSVANYLVYLWAKESGVGDGSNREVLVERRDQGPNRGTYAPEFQIFDWISQLRVRAVKSHLVLSPTAENRLSVLSPSPASGANFALALNAVETDLRRGQEGKELLLAAIFERGKGKDLLRMVQDSFDATRAIVVITVDATEDARDVLDDIEKVLSPDRGWLLKLGPVRGVDVRTIITDRWNHYRPDIPCPFDVAGAAEAFENNPRPIARTVKLLSGMLEMRQVNFAGDEPWPVTQRLFLDAKAMRDMLEFFDRNMNLGGPA